MTARPISPISPLEVDCQLSTKMVEHPDTYVGADMVNKMKRVEGDDGGMRERKSDQSLKSVIFLRNAARLGGCAFRFIIVHSTAQALCNR